MAPARLLLHFALTGCGFMRVTAALIISRGRLFVAQRPPWKKFGLLWEFPGGKVEPGESLEESLVREIKEELCLDIRVHGLFKNIFQQDRDIEIDLHAFWCEISGGTLRLLEHVACMWADVSQLKDMDFTRADRFLIPHLEGLSELPDFQQADDIPLS
jgi:8-oxo-dGTP diphosphatase